MLKDTGKFETLKSYAAAMILNIIDRNLRAQGFVKTDTVPQQAFFVDNLAFDQQFATCWRSADGTEFVSVCPRKLRAKHINRTWWIDIRQRDNSNGGNIITDILKREQLLIE